MIGATCPKCDRIHLLGDAVALSRFAGVSGYRTADGEIHATREDAQEWLCERRQERRTSPGQAVDE